MTNTSPVWTHAAAVPPEGSAYALEPRIYQHALRTPRTRWWHAVLALGLAIVVGSVVTAAPTAAALFVQMRVTGQDMQTTLARGMSPIVQAAALIGLALLTPVAWLTHRLVFGQGIGDLGSVVGRLRWRWVARLALVLTPVVLVYMGVFTWLTVEPVTNRLSQIVGYLLVGVLLFPFQAAGEEYLFRGLIPRAVGSWFSDERAAFVIATVVSSVLFMLSHGAGDVWLNAYYLIFGVVLCVAVRLTGGLEASIVVHAANNSAAALFMVLWTDVSSPLDRSAGAAGPFMLVPMVAVALLTAAACAVMRRRGVATRTSPIRPVVAEPAGRDAPR